jgi:uncharacterized protein YaaQ
MNDSSLDRLVLLTVSESQSGKLSKHLSQAGFQFTVINTTGGVVQEAVICLLIGLPGQRMPAFLEIVRTYCRAYTKFIPAQGVLSAEAGSLPLLEAQVGGALVTTMNEVRFEQF